MKFELTADDHDLLEHAIDEVILSSGFRMKFMEYNEDEIYKIFMHAATGRFYIYWNQTDPTEYTLTPVRRVPTYTYELED